MVYQFFTVEIIKNQEDQYIHDVKWYWDEDLDKARLKGESGFYEIMSRAAISDNKRHSAILFDTTCTPLQFNSYNHEPKINLEETE